MGMKDRERRENIQAGDTTLRYPPRPVPLNTALSYFRLGFSPIPLCDPEHKYVWRTHRLHCSSPGKAPLTTGWPRYAEATMTEADVRSLFQGHKGNVGLALRPGQFVLDVDARSGGLVSLEVLQGQHGALPDTPQVFTGGGGQHFYFSLPLDSKIPSGGTLTSIGFAGVQWKTHTERGGQVVAPPSVHASGNPYIWEVSNPIETTPLAPVPSWLLSLIQQAVDTDTPGTPRPQGANGAGKGRYSKDQVTGFFRRTYSEGERRVQSTGLPRLIGILKSRNVPAHRAIAFLVWWQQDHFMPPLNTMDLEAHVNGMYGRYGAPDAAMAEAGEQFLRYLYIALTAAPQEAHVGDMVGGYSDTYPTTDTGVKDAADEIADANALERAIYRKWAMRAVDLIPVPDGIPDIVWTLSTLKDSPGLLQRQAFGNGWENPVNAGVHRRKRLSHVMSKIEQGGHNKMYLLEVAADDWDKKWHDSFLTKARRRGFCFFWVDNKRVRREVFYAFTGEMEGTTPMEGLDDMAMEFSLHIADIEHPGPGSGRFRPMGFCGDWKMKRPEDKDKATYIGFRTGVDEGQQEEWCADAGVRTWTQEGDPVFEAGRRRRFEWGEAASRDYQQLGADDEGKRIALIRFANKTLGYILTGEAFALAFPAEAAERQRKKAERVRTGR